jgi:uncharacterized protein (TIGR03083 family)
MSGQPTDPPSEELVAAVGREGQGLLAAARQDLARAVPTYPGWSVADLVAHTGSVHRWVLGLLRSRATERPARIRQDERDPGRLLAWFEDGLGQLVAQLAADDPSTPVWSFGPQQTVGFWQSRMAHETAIHRWDAERAFGQPGPIEPRLAASGIVESLAIHVIRPLRGTAVGGNGESVALQCLDLPVRWQVDLLPAAVELREVDTATTATVSGSASDLWLFATGRPAQSLRVDGDEALVGRLQGLVGSVPPPEY